MTLKEWRKLIRRVKNNYPEGYYLMKQKVLTYTQNDLSSINTVNKFREQFTYNAIVEWLEWYHIL